MNGLDSSFEALAFIPVNLSPLLSAVAHNIWAWLAFFAAAFSFWRICALSLRTTSSHVPLSPPPPQRRREAQTVFGGETTSFEAIDDTEEEEREDEEEDQVEEQMKGRVVGVGLLTRGNSSNKFFTVYYEERENDDDDHHHVDDDDEDEKADVDDDEDEKADVDDDEMDGGDDGKKSGRRVVIKRWGSTGSTVEMRRSSSFSSSSSSHSSEYDMGWYSYQDRKVINGSVVRLWEEERESGGCVSPRNCRRPCLAGLTTLA